MACGDEEASARVRVWRRRRKRGEWCVCEEGPRGVLESGRAEVSGRVAILLRFLIPLLWRGGVPEATRTRTQCGVGGVCRLLTWMCIAGVGMKRIFSDREFV